MFQLPKLPATKQKKQKYMYAFGGINKTEDFRAGELETSEGVCFDNFPALSVRRERTKTNLGTAQDLFYANGMIKIYNAKETTDSETGETVRTCDISYRKEASSASWTSAGTLSAEAEAIGAIGKSGKEAIVLGNIAVVFPDKKYLDLNKTYLGWKNIEREISYSKDAAYVWNNKMVFLSSTHFSSFKDKFKVGDAVDFSGGYYGEDNKAVRTEGIKIIRDISSATDRTVTFDANSFGDANNDYSTPMTFTKSVPDLTKLCVWNGRLWGIDTSNNICASKYMDPTVFEYFDLTDADSYTIETDTTGDFTGAAVLRNNITFFKENKIHRISGTKPSNYRLDVFDLRGIKAGSDRSVCVIDDILYYEGTDGIYAYDGSRVKNISEKLGKFAHSDGVGGADKKRYFISLKTGEEEYTLYSYDTEKGAWLIDGNEQIKAMCNYLGKLHYLDKDGNIRCFDDEKSTTAEFSVTLREITEEFSEQKGFSRLYLCYSMAEGGSVKVEVSYGTGDNFRTAAVICDHRKCISEIRLEPNRSDMIRIRLTATPDVIIKNLMREHYAHGSVF